MANAHGRGAQNRGIAGLKCFQCKTPIDNLRSFKCHNWAYAKPALLKVIEQMAAEQVPR